MSNRACPEIQYHCSNDCRQEGCPGHTVQVIHHYTSDTVSVSIDGKASYYDASEWWAMLKSDREASAQDEALDEHYRELDRKATAKARELIAASPIGFKKTY